MAWFFVGGTRANRTRFYHRLIESTLKKNRSVLFLVPEKNILNFYALEFSKFPRNKLFIGFRSNIFKPPADLGLIIIDEEDSFTYKEERTPRYHAVRVAKYLACTLNVHLVIGNLIPSLDTYFLIQNKKVQVLQEPTFENFPTLSVINVPRQAGPFSFQVQEEIDRFSKNHSSILVFVPRKGEGFSFVCNDCAHKFLCPNCNLPLVQKDFSLMCHHCNFKDKIPSSCPQCGGVKFYLTNQGREGVKKIIQKTWPKDYFRVETKKILTDLNYQSDLTIVLNFDYLLSLPDLNIGQELFFLLLRLMELTKEKIIIETRNPSEPIFTHLKKLDFKGYFKKILSERKQYLFPPFVSLVRLIIQDKDEERVFKKASFLASNISFHLSKSNLDIQLLGPAPCFLSKIRGLYRWQILIKIPRNRIRLRNTILDLVPRDWQIDIDPITIL